MPSFFDIYGHYPETEAAAPGRINVLGEHTDYNDGYVLPLAIPQTARVTIAHSPDGYNRLYSEQCERSIVRYLADVGNLTGYSVYVDGCMRVLRSAGFALTAVSVHIDSSVPIGAGLSSSAALEVALLRALRNLFLLPLDDVTIALYAQQAEIRYAHVHCGIMDQMVASLGDAEHLLFLDTRSLARRRLPLPPDTSILVLDSGVPRRLADSAYNQRRAECAAAARHLSVTALRDITDLARLHTLPPPLDRRARHVVSENLRVLTAAEGVDAATLGQLMNASHASLRDDFQVSIPQLDDLVALLQADPAVYGARLTGAGFGGACVALVRAGEEQMVAEAVLNAYTADGRQGRRLV